ncbi:hypothetical protein ACQ4PT_041879 [Festuca glaucescens]
MANFPVDPSPFIPGQYEVIEVANCPQQSRYHISTPPSSKHEDVAIASIEPAFPGELPFAATRMFLRSFLEDELGFTLNMIQHWPIGFAYIRVSSPSDRDWLVNQSPHQFQDRGISFVEHNKGINHRAFTYNRECWIMLLAFPSDYWADEHIRGAVKDFGALISWDKEASTFGALIAKVRVVDLHCIPHSCVVCSGNEWSAESWSVPIYILSRKLLGGLPADEELPPADGSTPHPMPVGHFQGQAAVGLMDFQAQNVANGTKPHHFLGHNAGIDLNANPLHVGLDLNGPPHQLAEEEFLELNDLLNPMIPANGPLPVVLAMPAPVPAPAEDVDMLPNEDNHSDLTLTISSAHTILEESRGSVNGAPPNAHQQHLHIGMALTPEFLIDPVVASAGLGLSKESAFAASKTERETFLFSKEGTSAWSTHFKPDGSIVNIVNVLAQWADFFTAKLLTPEDFEWTKSLLQSKIWQILSDLEFSTNNAARAFVLPRKCPSKAPPVCILSTTCEQVTQGFMTPQAIGPAATAPDHFSTSALHVKKKGKNTPLVCTSVRRSNRLKAMNKGFKAKTCFDKNCLACAAAPQIKKSVVTNLCNRFNILDTVEEDRPDPEEVSPMEEDAPGVSLEEDASVVPAGGKKTRPAKKDPNAATKRNSKK